MPKFQTFEMDRIDEINPERMRYLEDCYSKCYQMADSTLEGVRFPWKQEDWPMCSDNEKLIIMLIWNTITDVIYKQFRHFEGQEVSMGFGEIQAVLQNPIMDQYDDPKMVENVLLGCGFGTENAHPCTIRSVRWKGRDVEVTLYTFLFRKGDEF